MLTHPSHDLLRELGLHSIAKGLEALKQSPDASVLSHAQWLGLLLEYEVTQRRRKRFEARARAARLRHNASVEDVNYRASRGLDRSLFLRLASCDFLREKRNLLIVCPCGIGKNGLPVRSEGMPRGLLGPLPTCASPVLGARAGAQRRPLCQAIALPLARRFACTRRLGAEPLNVDQRRDLLEIVEDRYDARSILISSQVRSRAGMTSSVTPHSPTPFSIATSTTHSVSSSAAIGPK
ncbi:ATP-binding protein [Bradyrhizobium zhanjiangense]|uniref:ATP-binding protein n=1 Tax=Bradyrhizobium zhanjiangense TaxID=1325107 RepID=UPI003B83163C